MSELIDKITLEESNLADVTKREYVFRVGQSTILHQSIMMMSWLVVLVINCNKCYQNTVFQLFKLEV